MISRLLRLFTNNDALKSGSAICSWRRKMHILYCSYFTLIWLYTMNKYWVLSNAIFQSTMSCNKSYEMKGWRALRSYIMCLKICKTFLKNFILKHKRIYYNYFIFLNLASSLSSVRVDITIQAPELKNSRYSFLDLAISLPEIAQYINKAF